MMSPAIDNPVCSEVFVVIRFLHAKKKLSPEIHRGLCVDYGQNVVNVQAVRRWCRMFTNGRTKVHDEEQSCSPTTLFKALNKIFVKVGASQFQKFILNFHNLKAQLPTRLSSLG
jgi:hypothetical protein